MKFPDTILDGNLYDHSMSRIITIYSFFSIMCTLEVRDMLTWDWELTESNVEFTRNSGTQQFFSCLKFLLDRNNQLNWFLFSPTRLIVVAEKEIVYSKFPIPLINRLEKHFLNISTMLSEVQVHLAQKLEKWAEQFIKTSIPTYKRFFFFFF